MELKGKDGALRLTAGIERSGSPHDEDLLLNVEVSVRGYSAADRCWVVGSDWERFLVELRALERARSGRAVVEGASPEDFRLEVFSTDSVGHMAVRGHVGRERTAVHALKFEYSFDFEPDRLSSLIRDSEPRSLGEGP